MFTMPHDPAVILIVDADPLTLTGMAATLDMAGYECHCAQDATAAIKAAKTARLDLIICDVSLDGESGLALANDLRQAYGEDVPLMFVTDSQAPDIVRRVHEAGGAYYLRKPLDPDVLVELVGKALWMPHLVRARIESATSEGAPPPRSLRARAARISPLEQA